LHKKRYVKLLTSQTLIMSINALHRARYRSLCCWETTKWKLLREQTGQLQRKKLT